MRRTLLILFTILAGVLIASQRVPSRVAYDQKLYHVPSIQQFADALPAFDPWDYLSATTPGYHLLFAFVYRLTGGSLLALQLLAAVITGGFFWLLATLVTRSHASALVDRSGSPPIGSLARRLPRKLFVWLPLLALCLPLLCSNYTLYPAAYMLPDGLGWLCVLAILAIALRDRITPAWLACAGALLVALVLTRQIHIWVAGPLVFASFLGTPTSQAGSLASIFQASLNRPTIIRGVLAIAACIPAVITLTLFIHYWGGLVPPRFQGFYPPRTLLDMVLSPSAAFYLTMSGIFGCFMLPFIIEPLRDLWQRNRAWIFIALAIGAVIAIIPETTYNYDAGRRTGVWNLTQKLPAIANHTSPIILLGSMWGALMLAALLSVQTLRARLIYLCAIAAYCAAMSASVETWQRYFDPMVLMVLALLCARAHATNSPRLLPNIQEIARIAGPAILSALLLAQSAWLVIRDDAATMHSPPPPAKSEIHQGGEPPVLFPPPVKPAGKHFWPV